MAITQIVLIRFKPHVNSGVRKDVCSRMLALKDQCVHKKTKRPYIKSLTGGKDNSTEGFQDGITHAFVIEFESVEDRDYYVKVDHVHWTFMRSLSGLLEKGQIIDFAPGVF